jgi:hypothetical protein
MAKKRKPVVRRLFFSGSAQINLLQIADYIESVAGLIIAAALH